MEELGVVPIDSNKGTANPKPVPKPVVKNKDAEIKSVLEQSMSVDPIRTIHQFESDEEYRKNGLRIRDFRSLKKGKFHRQATYYLRGYRLYEADEIIRKSIEDSVTAGHRCIKFIHGRGLNSPKGIAKIKLRTQQILFHNKHVLGYCRAQSHDGGRGATYVLLKTKSQAPASHW